MGLPEWCLLAAKGWELRMWLCQAINCRQYFSIVLLVRHLPLCDMALISEYVEGNDLIVQVVRRQLTDPTSQDLRLATEAIRNADRLQGWSLLSRGVHRHVTLRTGTAHVNPLVLAIQANYRDDPDLSTFYRIQCRPFSGRVAAQMILVLRRSHHWERPLGQATIWLYHSCCGAEPILHGERMVTMTRSSWLFRCRQLQVFSFCLSIRLTHDHERRFLQLTGACGGGDVRYVGVQHWRLLHRFLGVGRRYWIT